METSCLFVGGITPDAVSHVAMALCALVVVLIVTMFFIIGFLFTSAFFPSGNTTNPLKGVKSYGPFYYRLAY